MGLFGGNEACAICGGKVSALAKVKISDGLICQDCMKKCAPISSIGLKSSVQIKQRIQQRIENLAKYQSFSPTDSVPGHLEIDRVNKLWCVPIPDKKNPDLFSFSDLLEYELSEDGTSVTKGGLGSAVVGGLAFGGVGAIVGGGLGKKQKDIVTSMSVAITIRNDFVSRIEIPLISSETKKGSFIHSGMKDIGNRIVSLLNVISSTVQNEAPQPSVSSSVGTSAADELLKFKQLLDIGALTQDEYDAKKKQLLGL